MNTEYRNQIKEIRNDIKGYKVTFAILIITILTLLLISIILTKTNVISESALFYIGIGALASFICTVHNLATNIQSSNDRMFDLQQREIEELERKLLEKDEVVDKYKWY